MRDIKFRIWLPDSKEWKAADADGSRCGHRCMHVEKGVWTLKSSDKAVLQQWTGLHDKNGVEIYEGDIVTNPNWRKKFVVIWNEYGFDLQNVKKEGERFTEYEQESLSHYGWTIVGNIFENK